MAQTYEVTGISTTIVYDAANLSQRKTEVAFVTVPSKIAGSVILDSEAPTATEVDAAIVPEVQRLEAIKAL